MRITYDLEKCQLYGKELSRGDMKRFKIHLILKAFKRVKQTKADFDKSRKEFTITTIPSQFTFIYDTLCYSIEESKRLGATTEVDIMPLNTQGLPEEYKKIVSEKLRRATEIRRNLRDYLRGGTK